jgi:hypothetical protein
MKRWLFALGLLTLSSAALGQALPVGSTAVNTGQVTIGTSAASIVAARVGGQRVGRISVTITNVTGTGTLCVGNTGVTTATGECIAAVAGASITLNTMAQIFGIASAAGQTVSFIETY